MAISRRGSLDERTRQRLAAAAVQEFTERGYDDASLNRILTAAGVSKGRFYYHYRGKAGLLRSLIEETFEELYAHVGPVGRSPPSVEGFWEHLGRAYSRTMEFFLERPERAAIGAILVRTYRHPDLATDLAEVQRRSEAFLMRKVEEGRALGAVRADVPASFLVAAVIAVLEAADVWMARSWSELGERGLVRAPAMVLATVRRVAAPDPGTTQPGASRARGTR